jgi:hypothetical protein
MLEGSDIISEDAQRLQSLLLFHPSFYGCPHIRGRRYGSSEAGRLAPERTTQWSSSAGT